MKISRIQKLSTLTLALALNLPVSSADVYYLPRTEKGLPANFKDPLVRVKGAEVAYLNVSALRRDFEFLQSKTPEEIEKWILSQCGFVSEAQLELQGIRNSDIPTEDKNNSNNHKTGYRPKEWGRAAFVPVSDFDGKHSGLIDVKGIGLASDKFLTFKGLVGSEKSIQHQKEVFETALKTKNYPAIDDLRIKGHSDGLATAGEAVAEIVRSEALQRSFDIENSKSGTHYETVETYFIIMYPFSILKETRDGYTHQDRAALIGRQAHYGRYFYYPPKANIYVDYHGFRQRDFFGAAVDMGGVFPTYSSLKETFLRENQKTALLTAEKHSSDKEMFDPQKSIEWENAHIAARDYINGDKRAIYKHLEQMTNPIQTEWQEAKAKLPAHSRIPPEMIDESHKSLSIQETFELLAWNESYQEVLKTGGTRVVPFLISSAQNRNPGIQKCVHKLMYKTPGVLLKRPQLVSN